ncbi:iron chaperone [Companilactobacillus keshanensis]|uniref:Iron chaperone n=1 Tax=Companilactobacillus keshanensis TaxID=2486003 RepID=A0ABW4BW17_9LACO|nr:DUF1801 domain-containing protein [Companilactobacillus keshanensis]
MTVIENYINNADTSHQEKLNQIYLLIKSVVPEAEEKISYAMPTFYLKKNLVHFADFKHHLGFYPTPSAIVEFEKELKPYKTSKGAIQFTYEKPLPEELIKKIVQFRKEEIELK